MSNGIKTALLLGALSALFLLIGEALGGAQGLVVGFLFAVVTNFVSYWFSDKIVLRMYGATEVGPDHRLSSDRRRGSPRAPVCRSRAATSFRRRRPTRSRRDAIRSMRRWRRPRASCRCSSDEELEGVLAPRAGARQASRHPDQLGGGDDRRGDHDDLAVRDVLRRRRDGDGEAPTRSRCSRR